MDHDKHPQKGPSSLPILATLITLVAFVIMCILGTWQLSRAQQKQERLALIEQRQHGQVFNLDDVLAMNNDIRDYPVQMTGVLNASKLFLIDNKIHLGRVGYQVLVPLQTSRGWLMTNLGWVPGSLDRSVLPEVAVDQAQQRFNGTVSIPQSNPMIRETAGAAVSWPLRIQQIDLDYIQQHIDGTLLPFVLNLDAEHQAGFVRNWQPVVMPPEKHIAYAIQWFGLAIASLIVYFFALTKARKSNRNVERRD